MHNSSVALQIDGLRFSYEKATKTGSGAGRSNSQVPRRHNNHENGEDDNGGTDQGPLLISIAHLHIATGAIAVLMGDNGCGKTTLLKIMAGLLKPDAGKITKELEHPILVHQRPFLFAESVFANVAWPLRIEKGPNRVTRKERQERVRAALEELGIGHLARRWAPSLSGGEKQRVAIARALVTGPKLLLLDEPTSNIDRASVERIEAVLKKAAAAGVAVVMSTHNFASAYRLADKVLAMSRGVIHPPEVNILRGESHTDPDEHIGRFRVHNGTEIFCPTTARSRNTAVIHMDDIILSAQNNASSAQNHLRGVVRELHPIGHEVVRVDLDCGVPLAAHITTRSVDELKVEPGRELHISFKASAVELY